MNAFTPGLRCSKCRARDLAVFNSNLIQCSVCMAIDSLGTMMEDYFYCLDQIMPGAEFSRRDIITHLGFELNHYAYRKLTAKLFQKVSARKYRFPGNGD